MEQKRIINTALVTIPYEGMHWERLAKALAPANIIHVDKDDRDSILRALKEADIAILEGDIDEQFLREGQKLKWIHCDQSGLNFSARPGIFERNIMLTGSAGRSAPVLAEHVFFLILSLVYDAHGLYEMQRRHIWRGIPGYENRRGLYSKTIGIIGLGYAGKEAARLAKSFYMNVLGYARSRREQNPEWFDEVFYADENDSIDELLRRSDFVVLTVRLTDETYHLINKEKFKIMKNTAYLVNISRGSVVDEEALAWALKENIIAGAGCDTFEYEPLSKDSPLWDLPNMVITPHCTPEMPDLAARSLDIICDNIERYRNGKPLRNQLTPRDVYTKTGPF